MAREVDALLNPLTRQVGVDDPFGWDDVTQKIEKRSCDEPSAPAVSAYVLAEASEKELCQSPAFRKHPLLG